MEDKGAVTVDRIEIENLEVFAHHGVLQEENSLGQKFLISAKFYLQTKTAGLKDDISQSLDYSAVCYFIKKKLEERNYRLIEAVAEHLAQDLLLEYDSIRQVDLTVKKPWAPILLPLETVAVSISRKWHRVFLSIGSNLGDREGYLDFAIDQLNAQSDTKVVKIADYIETEPYGDVAQDDFLNSALEVQTLKEPYELLDFIHEVEKLAKRERIVHWGPRTLDIDILFYDNLIMGEECLAIPHPEIEKRAFVLEPMADIAPCFRHPVTGKTIRQLYEELKQNENSV